MALDIIVFSMDLIFLNIYSKLAIESSFNQQGLIWGISHSISGGGIISHYLTGLLYSVNPNFSWA